MNTDEILARLRKLRAETRTLAKYETGTVEQWAKILAEFCVLWDYLDDGLKNGARLPKDWEKAISTAQLHEMLMCRDRIHVPTKERDPTKTRCTACRHTKNLCTCGR